MNVSMRLWVGLLPFFVISVAVQSSMTKAELNTDRAGENALLILAYVALSFWVAITAKGTAKTQEKPTDAS